MTDRPLDAPLPLPRIWFDTNNQDAQGRHFLTVMGALRDMEPIADQLREGLRVVIYESELELEATLEFNSEFQCWMARPIEGTLKYYD